MTHYVIIKSKMVLTNKNIPYMIYRLFHRLWKTLKNLHF
nr:MAG TPA: Inner membrane protein import complex subunit Tim54 [Caudoviricetes sp.]